MKQKIYGVVPPISTPIDEHEHVDEKALRKLIDHCIDKGLHGIFVCGTNGECLGLTQAERNRAIKITLDQVAGRVPVLAGCMDTSTARVIDNIKAFEQMGGQTAVVTPEFYSRHSTPDETIRHFEQVAKHTEADIFIYNIPPFTGNTMSPKAVFEMATFDHIVGYKKAKKMAYSASILPNIIFYYSNSRSDNAYKQYNRLYCTRYFNNIVFLHITCSDKNQQIKNYGFIK